MDIAPLNQNRLRALNKKPGLPILATAWLDLARLEAALHARPGASGVQAVGHKASPGAISVRLRRRRASNRSLHFI
jgi:hypothetical protein